MGKEYHLRKQEAIDDIAKWAGQHVMKEEPVRSFRFHGLVLDKRYDKGRVDRLPGFATFTPVQSAKFGYTSTYAFTLTWTPGHMSIVGDLGELTVVHYHAMPTFAEACNWLQSSDYDYLLSKTNVRKEYDADQSFAWFRRQLNEEPIEHIWGSKWPRWVMIDGEQQRITDHRWGEIAEERAWRKQQPRGGQINEEEENVLEWFDNRPFNPIRDHEADCWEWWRKLAKELGYGEDCILTAKYRHMILDDVREKFQHEQIAADFLWRDMGWDDPSLAYEYPMRAFIQIAAIQHGVRMIEALTAQKEAA